MKYILVITLLLLNMVHLLSGNEGIPELVELEWSNSLLALKSYKEYILAFYYTVLFLGFGSLLGLLFTDRYFKYLFLLSLIMVLGSSFLSQWNFETAIGGFIGGIIWLLNGMLLHLLFFIDKPKFKVK